MPDANIVPEEVPAAVLRWIENPIPDRNLGDKILNELRHKFVLVKY